MDTQTKVKTALAFASPFLLTLPVAYTAYSIRDSNAKIRFAIGFISNGLYLQIISKFANPIVMNVVTTESQRTDSFLWVYHHVIYYMLMSISHTPFFAGNKYYNNHNIKNLKQALIASMIPAQVYFHKKEDKDSEEDSDKTKQTPCLCPFKQTVKTVAHFAAIKLICNIITENNLTERIEASPIVHMEVLALLKALMLPLHNIPSIILGTIFSEQLTIDVPYSFTYFLTSPREFWKHWSKPAAELYRYMVYEPMGGRNNAFIATSSIFLLNCVGHIGFSQSLYGNKNMKKIQMGWLKGFSVLGIAVASQIVAEKKCPKTWHDSLWWKGLWLSVFHGSMCSALWWIRDYALVTNIPSICRNFE